MRLSHYNLTSSAASTRTSPHHHSERPVLDCSCNKCFMVGTGASPYQNHTRLYGVDRLTVKSTGELEAWASPGTVTCNGLAVSAEIADNCGCVESASA